MKPKLLVLELWGMGDLAFATPFLQAAVRKFQVFLLAKPYAIGLRPRFWPEVEVISFAAPWTVHRGKYRLHRWPWAGLGSLVARLRRGRFDLAVSGRWDPRDHLLLFLSGARQRWGYPRVGSGLFLTGAMPCPPADAHRYDYWLGVARALGIGLPPRAQWIPPDRVRGSWIVVHTGAAQAVRVWSLDRYLWLVRRIRQDGGRVQVLCDPGQRAWWLGQGEADAIVPTDVTALMGWLDQAALVVANDSGPGHVAAVSGVPTFTIFGPQLAPGFVPLHPRAEYVSGKDCPYKPCFDYCRFPEPHCLNGVSTDEVWSRLDPFIRRQSGR